MDAPDHQHVDICTWYMETFISRYLKVSLRTLAHNAHAADTYAGQEEAARDSQGQRLGLDLIVPNDLVQ